MRHGQTRCLPALPQLLAHPDVLLCHQQPLARLEASGGQPMLALEQP